MKLLVWRYGDEAVCPGCGNNNACLGGRDDVYTCRDCGRHWRAFGATRITERCTTGSLAGRVVAEQDCEEVFR